MGTLVNISAPERQDQIAGTGVFCNVCGNFRKFRKPDSAGDLFGKLRRVNAVGVLFTAAHDLGENDFVGMGKYAGKIVHQHFGARIGKGLMNRPDPLERKSARRFQSSFDLGRMVAVIISNCDAADLRQYLEPASGTAEGINACRTLLRRDSGCDCRRTGRNRI